MINIAKLVEPLVDFFGKIYLLGEGAFALIIIVIISAIIVVIASSPFIVFWLMTRKFKVEKKK